MYVKRVRHHRDVGYLPNLAGPDPHHLIDAGHIHRFSIDREGAATRHHAAHAHVQHKLAGSNRARRFGCFQIDDLTGQPSRTTFTGIGPALKHRELALVAHHPPSHHATIHTTATPPTPPFGAERSNRNRPTPTH